MILKTLDKSQSKGWFFGSWNSKLTISVGYANEGINEQHYHEKMYEVYLVAQGSSVMLINNEELVLKQGEAIAVEPSEVHTFISSTPDYLHFVIHTPFVKGDKVVL